MEHYRDAPLGANSVVVFRLVPCGERMEVHVNFGDVEIDGDKFVVDATLLGAAFGLSAREVRASMQDGRITSRTETGTGADAGRWRLTFYHNGRALRLTVNAEGEILMRSTFDVPSTKPGMRRKA